MAKQTTPAAQTNTTPATETAKTKYQTMIIGVPKERKAEFDKLEALATKLSCRPSALVWLGIGAILASPPASAPAGATVTAGSACGFWAAPIKDTKGKCVGATVVEVASRGDASGQTFFRYTHGDEKARTRALNQAKRGAQYLLDLVGIKGEPTVTELAKAK